VLGMRRWQTGVEELAVIFALGEAAPPPPAPDSLFPGEWQKIFDSENVGGLGRRIEKKPAPRGAYTDASPSFRVTVYSNSSYEGAKKIES